MPDWAKPIIYMLLLLCAAFAVRANLASARARRLKRAQQALTADLDAMQLALVPELPSRIGELEISVAYRPADGPAAGGDFYDAVALEGGRVAIILGDVSGHGRAALAHAARMRYTLRAYVEAGLAPRSVLKLAASVIGAAEDDFFITVAIAVYEASTASLTYATAGHPSPLALGAAAHDSIASCAAPALGWGIPSGSRQTRVPFPDGSSACFFSDGLTEARIDQDLLGRRRLATMFTELGPQPCAQTLLEQVQEQAQEIRDDMSACIIRATGGAADPGAESWLEEFELGPDQLASGQGQRFLEACGVAADSIAAVIAQARVIASGHGATVLAVKGAAGSRSATASAPTAVAPANPMALSAEAFSLPARQAPTQTERPKSPAPV